MKFLVVRLTLGPLRLLFSDGGPVAELPPPISGSARRPRRSAHAEPLSPVALTDNCDLFGSVHEDGVNLVARHVMRQRPSLFNYGTAQVAANRKLWCERVDVAPDVLNFADPIMTVVPPLPVADTGYGVNYSLQITKAEIDFHPGNVITLPSELSPPLANQHFAAHAEVCGGIGCPPKEIVDRLPPPRPTPKGDEDRPPKPLTPLPTRRLECFCLEVFVVGHVEVDGDDLVPMLDGLEIVDIKPDGLESSLECYLELLIKLAILPQLRVAIPTFVFDILNLATVTLTATPISGAVPNNPAIEDHQLKAFVDVAVGP